MDNKSTVILLTGASSGIGKDIGRRLAEQGYTLYATARRTEEMRDLKELGARTLYIDVTDAPSIKKVMDTLLHEQGKIDVLINNAGWGYLGNIENGEIDGIKQMYDVNFFGYVRMIQAVLPHMRKRRSGRIINVSSVLETVSTLMQGWYASTKHAIGAMTDALRQEVTAFGIKTILIRPGVINTPFEEVGMQALKSIDYADDYKALAAGFAEYWSQLLKNGSTCEPVTDAVLDAIVAENPGTRYDATPDAVEFARMRKAISDEEYDQFILSQLAES